MGERRSRSTATPNWQALRYNLFTLFTSTALIHDAPRRQGADRSAATATPSGTSRACIPALCLLFPDAAARLLQWRHATLDAARDRAMVLGVDGASFAWRTIDGHEVSAYWPASTAALHVNADISRAFWLYGNVTGRGAASVGGLEVLVDTARLWMSVGHDDFEGSWHLFGVTGPDEYTGVVDDNVFTNLMARRNLLRAAEACEESPEQAGQLGVDAAELHRWRSAVAAVHVPWDERKQVHLMNTNFTNYREWRFGTSDSTVQQHQHYAKFYRRQVLKQADMVQALWWCREDFTAEQVARDVDYYEARTVRDSSLSACVQAVVCAQAQHPDLAYRYLRESALTDLADVRGDTVKGLHMASVGGTWLAFAAVWVGCARTLTISSCLPCCPASWSGCVTACAGATGCSTSRPPGRAPRSPCCAATNRWT